MSDSRFIIPQVIQTDVVDENGDPRGYVAFMDRIRGWPLMATQKKRSIEELRLSRGDAALDVGCGTGEEVVAMAKEVADTGRCVGIDASETMLAEARRRTGGLGLIIEFNKGDVYDIQFGDEVFNGVRAERVLEHLDHPEKALSELVRVTRRGGRVVAIAPDFDSFAFDFPDRDIARTLTHFMCDQKANGWAGRRLYGMFQDAGLSEISCEVFTHIHLDPSAVDFIENAATLAEAAGLISSDALRQALVYAKAMRSQSRVFYTTPNFLIAGTRS